MHNLPPGVSAGDGGLGAVRRHTRRSLHMFRYGDGGRG